MTNRENRIRNPRIHMAYRNYTYVYLYLVDLIRLDDSDSLREALELKLRHSSNKLGEIDLWFLIQNWSVYVSYRQRGRGWRRVCVTRHRWEFNPIYFWHVYKLFSPIFQKKSIFIFWQGGCRYKCIFLGNECLRPDLIAWFNLKQLLWMRNYL